MISVSKFLRLFPSSLIVLCLGVLLFPSRALAQTPLSETSSSARARALEVAAAFSNDGYKLRDGFWAVEAGQAHPPLKVFLFEGNFYWFTAATPGQADSSSKLSLELFDESGNLVTGETYEDSGIYALGIAPAHTGVFFLKATASPGTPFVVVYSYK